MTTRLRPAKPINPLRPIRSTDLATTVPAIVLDTELRPAKVPKYVAPSSVVRTDPMKDHCCAYSRCAYAFWNTKDAHTMRREGDKYPAMGTRKRGYDPNPARSRIDRRPAVRRRAAEQKSVVWRSARRGPLRSNSLRRIEGKTGRRAVRCSRQIARGKADFGRRRIRSPAVPQ